MMSGEQLCLHRGAHVCTPAAGRAAPGLSQSWAWAGCCAVAPRAGLGSGTQGRLAATEGHG